MLADRAGRQRQALQEIRRSMGLPPSQAGAACAMCADSDERRHSQAWLSMPPMPGSAGDQEGARRVGEVIRGSPVSKDGRDPAAPQRATLVKRQGLGVCCFGAVVGVSRWYVPPTFILLAPVLHNHRLPHLIIRCDTVTHGNARCCVASALIATTSEQSMSLWLSCCATTTPY